MRSSATTMGRGGASGRLPEHVSTCVACRIRRLVDPPGYGKCLPRVCSPMTTLTTLTVEETVTPPLRLAGGLRRPASGQVAARVTHLGAW